MNKMRDLLKNHDNDIPDAFVICFHQENRFFVNIDSVPSLQRILGVKEIVIGQWSDHIETKLIVIGLIISKQS